MSYFDYYQPEAYLPRSDTYIEKDSSRNDEIDRLRHAATHALFERRDVMIPMRDGVKLHTVIVVPKGAKGAPILLTRTPYDATELTSHAQSARWPAQARYRRATIRWRASLPRRHGRWRCRCRRGHWC